MIVVKRFIGNPILSPEVQSDWEADSVFNPCCIKKDDTYNLFYRAVSRPKLVEGNRMNFSTIGHAVSTDGFHFSQRRQFIYPQNDWEKYGCEDPKTTYFEGKYFIFYTALSSFPFNPDSIKVALAVSRDLKTIEEKYQVTNFNSKAMALFPERINGQIAAVLTVNTDRPPAKISVAYFQNEDEIHSSQYWNYFFATLSDHVINIHRSNNDHIEVGAGPVKTAQGWLLFHSYIKNYLGGGNLLFGIEVLLLDLQNPQKILGRTREPILVPEKHYELFGKVPNVVFPSGAILDEEYLHLYYGASDTTCAVADIKTQELMDEIYPEGKLFFIPKTKDRVTIERYSGNPIITAIADHKWESFATFNPAAIYEDNKVFILYRTNDHQYHSFVGMAVSSDGLRIDERLINPIYAPREDFEIRNEPGNSGCEDGRVVKIGDRFFMTYTAYTGYTPPRIAITSISVSDFLGRAWNRWDQPKLISPPGIDDKNCCVLPELYDNKYVFFHRLQPCIWMDYTDDINFGKERFLSGKVVMTPRVNSWDSEKIGIGGPLIKTDDGWLMIYHGVSKRDYNYRLGAALFSLEDPIHLIARLDYPILEPDAWYENEGQRAGTVFACGNIVKDGQIFIYYGGADQVVCVGTVGLKELLNEVKRYKTI